MLQITRFFFLFLLLSAILFAQETNVVPIDREPAHHFAVENEYVRVFDVVVQPEASTLMHRHDRDYTFVILGDSDISNERMNEKPVHIELKDGDIRYSKGGFAHVARNLAKTPFHNITIELKNPGAAVCGTDPAHGCQDQKIFDTQHAFAQLITIEAGQQGPLHTHKGPHLGVAVDDLTFENHVSNQPAVTLSMKKGETTWISAFGTSHYFKNVGNTRGRLFILEFK
jgi:quercetin dioxygenase-like cupin family protein